MRKISANVRVHDSGITEELLKLAAKVPKTRNKVLAEAAKYMAEEIEKETPYDPDKEMRMANRKNLKDYSLTHMRDDVKYSRVHGHYWVGSGKDTGWRAHFINNGTVYIKPTFFFDKVVESKLPVAQQMILHGMKRELGLW